MKKQRLFCFPSAGSSASMFFPLRHRLKGSIDVCPVEQAGKGVRIKEHSYPDFASLVNDAVSEMISTGGLSSFALLGYSMGSLVAYEVSVILFQRFSVLPQFVLFAACPPPHVDTKMKNLYESDDRTLVEELTRLGGIPTELVDHPHLLNFFLLSIRSDFRLLHDYKKRENKVPLPVDIAVLYSEAEAEDSKVFEWNNYTTKTCRFYEFSDGHFFINTHVDEIAAIVKDALRCI